MVADQDSEALESEDVAFVDDLIEWAFLASVVGLVLIGIFMMQGPRGSESPAMQAHAASAAQSMVVASVDSSTP